MLFVGGGSDLMYKLNILRNKWKLLDVKIAHPLYAFGYCVIKDRYIIVVEGSNSQNSSYSKAIYVFDGKEYNFIIL